MNLDEQEQEFEARDATMFDRYYEFLCENDTKDNENVSLEAAAILAVGERISRELAVFSQSMMVQMELLNQAVWNIKN